MQYFFGVQYFDRFPRFQKSNGKLTFVIRSRLQLSLGDAEHNQYSAPTCLSCVLCSLSCVFQFLCHIPFTLMFGIKPRKMHSFLQDFEVHRMY